MWNRKKVEETNVECLKVAEYFLYLSQATGLNATKLQKLMYYAQSLHLVLYQNSLFKEDFEAWVHGPMLPQLYYHYQSFGTKDIPPLNKPPIMKESSIQAIEIAWKMYGKCSGKYLERKAFREKPFQIARNGIPYYETCNEIISKELMKASYQRKITLNHKRMEAFS